MRLVTGQAIGEIWWFFIFPRWRPSTILDLSCTCLDNPQKAFAHVGGVYYCLKFGWNRCGSFDNMQVLIVCDLGLKTPIHAPEIWVLGANRGRDGAVLSPNKLVLTFGVVTSVPLLAEIDQELRL